MYQVITMFGDNEPWWFFEDWQTDIEEEKTFHSLKEAEVYYIEKWQELSTAYKFLNTKVNYMAAFWNEGDERWCEECNEDIQQYKGLALLKEYQEVVFKNETELNVKQNNCVKPKVCKNKRK